MDKSTATPPETEARKPPAEAGRKRKKKVRGHSKILERQKRTRWAPDFISMEYPYSFGFYRSQKKIRKIDWGEGLFRWGAFQAENGTGVVPDDFNDTDLLDWVEDQRKDYWRMKSGKKSFLDGHLFDMLSRRGFDWGPNPHIGAAAEEEEEMSKKPKARATGRSKPKKPPVEPTLPQHAASVIPNVTGDHTGVPSTTHQSPGASSGKSLPNVSTEKSARNLSDGLDGAALNRKAHENEKNDTKITPTVTPNQMTGPTTKSKRRVAAPKRKSRPVKATGGGKRAKGGSSSATKITTTSPVANEELAPGKVDSAELDSKPAAKRIRNPVSRAKSVERVPKRKRLTPPAATASQVARFNPESSVDEDTHNPVNQAGSRYPRRSTRNNLPVGLSERFEMAGFDGFCAKRRFCLLEYPEFEGVKMLKKVDNPTIKRLVPQDKEQALFDEVINESADLLMCDEKLVFEKGDNYNTYRANVAFEQRFFEYLVFKKVCGHGIVPKIFPENEALGNWSARNRQFRNSGEGSLTKSRIERLDAAGFVWESRKHPDFWRIVEGSGEKSGNRWEGRMQMLREYKEKHGDCLVPKEFHENMVGTKRKPSRTHHTGVWTRDLFCKLFIMDLAHFVSFADTAATRPMGELCSKAIQNKV